MFAISVTVKLIVTFLGHPLAKVSLLVCKLKSVIIPSGMNILPGTKSVT